MDIRFRYKQYVPVCCSVDSDSAIGHRPHRYVLNNDLFSEQYYRQRFTKALAQGLILEKRQIESQKDRIQGYQTQQIDSLPIDTIKADHMQMISNFLF